MDNFHTVWFIIRISYEIVKVFAKFFRKIPIFVQIFVWTSWIHLIYRIFNGVSDMSKRTTSSWVYMGIKINNFHCIKLYHFNSRMLIYYNTSRNSSNKTLSFRDIFSSVVIKSSDEMYLNQELFSTYLYLTFVTKYFAANLIEL